jgi:mannose-1-phosphate guanylyltransferase
MIVLPADHLIGSEENFRQTLLNAAKIAVAKKVLLTIGIRPTFPATGYGYIQFGHETVSAGPASARRVKTFAEKPNFETAKIFLASGDFLWNSGIFVWRISTISEQFEEHLPQLHDGLQEIAKHLGAPEEHDVVARVYQQIKSISIDYGVMEKAKNVLVLPSNFEWNDLGSWDEVYKLSPKDKDDNALCEGDHALLNTSGCFIDVAGKTVAAVGIRDLIVVETDDALLLCPREHAQDVKEVVELLKRKKKLKLL